MNNPNDNKSADGNWGKKIPSVALSKKKDMAKKMVKDSFYGKNGLRNPMSIGYDAKEGMERVHERVAGYKRERGEK